MEKAESLEQAARDDKLRDLYARVCEMIVNCGGQRFLTVDNPPEGSVAKGPFFVAHVPMSESGKDIAEAILRCAYAIVRLELELAEQKRQVWVEAAKECEAVMLRESEWRQADYGAQLTGVGAARELADKFRARGEQVK